MHFHYAPQSLIAALLLSTSLFAGNSSELALSKQSESFSQLTSDREMVESENSNTHTTNGSNGTRGSNGEELSNDGSISLVTLLRSAKKSSPKIKAATYLVKEKKAKRAQSKSARLPTIKLTSKVLQPIDKGASPKGNVGIAIDLPLINLKTGKEITIAGIDFALEKRKRFDSTQSLYLSVIESYYAAIHSTLETRIQSQKVRRIKEQIAKSDKDPLLRAQYYSALSVQQGKMTEASSQLQKLQNLTRCALVDSDQLINEAPTPKILSVADLRLLSNSCNQHLDYLCELQETRGSWLNPADQEALCISVIESSEKCAKAHLEFKKAKEQWGKEQAGLYPTVKAGVTGSAEAKFDAITNTTQNASCSIELAWNLFDGGSCRSAMAATRAAAKQKKALWVDACLEVEADLQKSLADLEKLYITWLSTKLQLESSKKHLLSLKEENEAPLSELKDLDTLIKRIDFFDHDALSLSDPTDLGPLKSAGLQKFVNSQDFINRLDGYVTAQQSHLKVCFDIRIAYYKLAKLAGLDLYEVAKNPSLLHLWKKNHD